MHKFIPTPSVSALSFGPFAIHFYALCIIVGTIFAIVLGDRRFRARGGGINIVSDVAIITVPAGIIGGRLYHLITSPDAYFGEGGRPMDAFKIWEGGLGIWGAIACGTLAAWWQLNRLQKRGRAGVLNFAIFADALAPGILLAQALGRVGNWFNAELFGRPTKLPWGLEIPVDSRPVGYQSFATFHPTFLYEALWCLFVAVLLVKYESRFKEGQGFLFYVAAYCLGRFFIEMVRIDDAHHIFGIRINVFVSAIVGSVAAYLFWKKRGVDSQL
ncbi:MAG: prolipoprotein diacylglyceryl transferase [Actinomycetota bacterium]